MTKSKKFKSKKSVEKTERKSTKAKNRINEFHFREKKSPKYTFFD